MGIHPANQSTKGMIVAGIVSAGLLVAGPQPILSADFVPSTPLRAEPSDVAIWAGMSELASATITTSSLSNPKTAPYYAKGDGVTDDSAALQAWLNAGGTRLANGTYRIVKGLTLNGNNRRFYTENAKIVADGTNITALTVTGSNASISAYVDGKNKAAYGVKVTGAGAVLENGRYENFRSATQSARGIDATTAGGIIVRNNFVRNVVSVGDTTLGNGNGASRGIALNAPGTATGLSFISGNYIENITGEEGDAIQVIFSDGTSNPYNSGKATVADNEIRNVSRRFIKIQASDVTVQGNKLNFDLPTRPTNPASSIDIIHAQNVKVSGNEVNTNLLGPCIIAVSGTSGAPLRGIEVRSNTLRQAATKKSVGIYLTWAAAPIIQDNQIYISGTAVLMSWTTGALQQGNTQYGGV